MRSVRLLAALLILVLTGPVSPAEASTPAPGTTAQLGIQLLDAPVSERDDPRARLYIVDQLEPGATIVRHLRVSNLSRDTAPVAVYTAAASIGGGAFRFADGRATNELSSWVSLDATDLRISPQGHRDLTIRIAVPDGAGGGERYGVIWAQRTSAGGTGNVTGISRVGIRIYLDVAGAPQTTDFAIGRVTSSRDTSGTPHLTAQISNTGQRAIDVSGTVALDDGPGATSVKAVRTDQVVTIAPGGTEPISASFARDLSDGPWRATITLASGTVSHLATARVQFPGAGATSTAVTAAVPASTVAPPTARSSWIWWWLLAGFAVLLVIAAAVWWWVRS